MKRKLSFVLVLAILASMAMSCGSAGEENETTSGEESVETTRDPNIPMTPEESRRAVPDDIPALDFGGAEFRTFAQESSEKELYKETLTGDVYDDAIYNRNKKVEERFNVNIVKTQISNYGEMASYLQPLVLAGDDAFELIMPQMGRTALDIMSGIYADWNEIPYINLSKPWYPSLLKENTNISGKTYMIASDVLDSFVYNTSAMYFDVKTAADYNIPDLYQLVDEGKWTVEKLFSFSKDIYEDLDGDGKQSDGDFYGLATDVKGCCATSYFTGMGIQYVEVKDGEVIKDINNDKFISAVEILRDAFKNNEGVRPYKTYVWTFPSDHFLQERSLFCASIMNCASIYFKERASEFGILPFPKFDEDQDKYYSAIDLGASVFTVLKTAKNTEMIGAVVEALSAESWKEVTPVYYDIVLDAKVANDEGTIRMMDIIFDGRVLDFGTVFDGGEGWANKVHELLTANLPFGSFYARNVDLVNNHYKNVLEFHAQ